MPDTMKTSNITTMKILLDIGTKENNANLLIPRLFEDHYYSRQGSNGIERSTMTNLTKIIVWDNQNIYL